MQKKSDKDLSNVSGGKGANYFRKGLALGLTALSVGSTVQTGTFAAEVKQNANTKSFGEKAKEFFSKAKGKVYNFVDAHPGATLLLALGATNVANTFVTWGLTKRHYNKTQTEIKQEINGARAQLLATCKGVITVESSEYKKKLEAFETAVDKKVKEFKFDKGLKIDAITVDAVNEFKALFGNVSEKSNVFNALLTVDGYDGGDLSAYITNIRAEIARRLQNDSESKLAGLKTEQLSFLNTVIGYAENVVMLKQVERTAEVTSEVTGAKQIITDNLNSIQGIISKANEEAFKDTSSDWRNNGGEVQANEYKAVVTEVRKSFEKVLESVFGESLPEAIKTVMNSLIFFEENIIDTASGHKLKDLTDGLPSVTKGNDGKTVSDSEADKTIVNNLANAADLKDFVNVILAAIKTATVNAEASGLAAKFQVVKIQKDFLSSAEKAELEKKAILIEEIAKLLTIADLKEYANATTEFTDLDAAKKAFTESNFVKTVDEWVKKLKENQGKGDDKIFAENKLDGIENLTGRVNKITGNVGGLAGEIDTAFNALITDVKNLFNDGGNFNADYKSVIDDIKDHKKPGILADKYVDTFQLAGKGLFKEKKKFEADKANLKKLYKDENSLADSLESVTIGTSQLKQDSDDSNGLNGKIGGNAENLKVLLQAMVGDALYAKLTNAFDGFDALKGVEITKVNLENKTKDGFSYKFFDKLNKIDDSGKDDIKAFKTWIKDTVGLDTTPSSGKVTKSIWDLIKEANGTKK